MSTPIIQVDCASCGAAYRLQLPNVLVQKPERSMAFRCNNCGYKFQIQPSEILEQPDVASTLILVRTPKFSVYHNLESVVGAIESRKHGSDDMVRIFGKPWVLLGDAEEFRDVFHPVAEEPLSVPDDNKEVQQPPPSSESPQALQPEAKLREMELSEDEHEIKATVKAEESQDLSESEYSEIDPFSEYEEPVVDNVLGDIFNTSPSETNSSSVEEDDFDDWDVEELDAEITDTPQQNRETSTASQEEWDFDSLEIDELDVDDSSKNASTSETESPVLSEVDAETAIQDFMAAEDSEDEALKDAIVDQMREEFGSWLDDDLQIDETDLPEETQAQITQPESDFDDLSVEDIQANLLDELYTEDESDEKTVASSPAPKKSVQEPKSEDVENQLKSLKSALLDPADKNKPESDSGAQEDGARLRDSKSAMALDEEPVVADVEFDDLEDEVQDSPSKNIEPKNRLSFSNRVPEVKTVKKREVNQLYIFAGIIFFSIGVLGYVLWNSEPTEQEFSGMATNSDALQPSEEAKEGLQENSGRDADAAPDAENAAQATAEGSDDSLVAKGEEAIAESGMPMVLPDVPEESLDFAGDKTPTSLTREGFQALKNQDPDRAKRLFELALKKNPNFADAIMGLGKMYRSRGEDGLAIQQFCRYSDLPMEDMTRDEVMESVQYSLGLVTQMGGDCMQIQRGG